MLSESKIFNCNKKWLFFDTIYLFLPAAKRNSSSCQSEDTNAFRSARLCTWQSSPETLILKSKTGIRIIDEALFLADRLIMIVDDLAAQIGEVMDIPRDRPQIMKDPLDYNLRNWAGEFLYQHFAHDDMSNFHPKTLATRSDKLNGS